MSLATFLATLARVLRDADIPSMLTGSLAAAFYGTPRATQDVDVVIDPDPERLLQLTDNLRAAGLYVDAEAAAEAFRTSGQFNAIDPESGWKADLIFRKRRDFSQVEFQRRQPTQLLGVEISLTTLEDLIVAKLEWSERGDSELQRRDIAELMRIAGDSLDYAYLNKWIEQLGLQPAWARIQDSIP